jgi:fructoselysine-6-P-deglycase FrlB-like protein
MTDGDAWGAESRKSADSAVSFTSQLKAAQESTYFSAPHTAGDLEAFYRDGSGQAAGLGEALLSSGRLVLVGSGGSLACLMTAQYILERFVSLPIEVVPGVELRWRAPQWLDADTTVVINSWSGRNADVLDSLDYATTRGARTVALVGNPDSALARGSEFVISYSGTSIYEVPIAAIVYFVISQVEALAASALQAALDQVPQQLSTLMPAASSKAVEDSETLSDADHIYVLGAGPCSSLALKMANVLMENVRIGAAFYDTVEFRHGAVEALERTDPTMLFLIGEDESRRTALRVRDFCIEEGARVVSYDAAEYGLVEPLLAPLVMNAYLQWFVVTSALRRAITDLDERVYMGSGKLSAGGWP